VEGVLSFLQENPVTAAALLESKSDENYLVAHSAHVFYLSIVMGTAVRARVAFARRTQLARQDVRQIVDLNLTPLGLAALYMDGGMWPLQFLYDQPEPLTEEECELVRQHPIASAGMLPSDAPEATRVAVTTHHENFDGSGYPHGLKGNELHLFSRILRISDAYSAATANTVYREACSPVRALWEMTMGPFAQFFDPVILKIFAGLIHPFPIGAKVRLNCGRHGVVVRYGEVRPFHPEVIITFDENGVRLPQNKLEGPIKLHERTDLTIVSFAGEDLRDIYTDEDPEAFTLAPSEFTTLYESAYTGCAVAAVPSR
jgi:HD-GYP domain-containing protein (c-di-GMP phosphodiesterase class II)